MVNKKHWENLADLSTIKRLVHQPGLSRRDCLLILLSANGGEPMRVSKIEDIGKNAGIRSISKWNISNILGASNSQAIRTTDGWELGESGVERLAEIGLDLRTESSTHLAKDLRDAAKSISDPNVRSFIDEAITCLERRCYRAATVISWVGAVSVLYNHVLAHKLTEFNREATRRHKKWKPAKTFDDFADMKEDEFLDVLHAISVIGKSVKDDLKIRLKTRNGAGHPNSYQVGENMIRAHIESLINHVFSKF